MNLRWQKCVQLISSTVAPSSGFLLPNTEHHRKSQANTLKHNRCTGAKRGCPGLPCSLSQFVVESHPVFCSYTDNVLSDCRLQVLYIINTLIGEICAASANMLLDIFDLFLTFHLMCFYFTVGYFLHLFELNCLMAILLQSLERMGTIRKKHYSL